MTSAAPLSQKVATTTVRGGLQGLHRKGKKGAGAGVGWLWLWPVVAVGPLVVGGDLFGVERIKTTEQSSEDPHGAACT